MLYSTEITKRVTNHKTVTHFYTNALSRSAPVYRGKAVETIRTADCHIDAPSIYAQPQGDNIRNHKLVALQVWTTVLQMQRFRGKPF